MKGGITMNEKNDIVLEIVSYIESHLQEKIRLDDISQNMNYSKYYLNRIFSSVVGCTMHKYIQRRRLTEAARLLAETDIPIAEISSKACYDSQQAFTLAFRQLYQYTPQACRSLHFFTPKQEPFVLIHEFCPALHVFANNSSQGCHTITDYCMQMAQVRRIAA